jgi:hypothetical protein
MKCPGQDTQYWKPGAIFEVRCPECDRLVEFFKDDTTRKCTHCGHRFLNPKMDFGCASYCQYAEQCLGDLPPELLAQKEDLLKDRVAVEVKRYFRTDFKRIGHAMRVARYAERIAIAEKGNMAVVLAAAYLRDVGILEAERRHGRTAAAFQELEGPAVARSILEKLGAGEKLIAEVCDIVGHRHPRQEETSDFKIVHDADLIAIMEEQQKNAETAPDSASPKRELDTAFLTAGGRRVAREVLVEGS